MCTAVTYRGEHHYFGRNLDLEGSFGEEIVVVPRNMMLPFRHEKTQEHHFGIIGTALNRNGYPLFYDATNEMGLSMAGLNYPGNAVYQDRSDALHNVAPFELIPWVLGQCASAAEAERLLGKTNVICEAFSDTLKLTPLHWMISDRERSLVAEPEKDGLTLYENSIGVLTNNPPFPVQISGLRNYLNLSAQEPESRFAEGMELKPYSRGMGALGLPGDYSSSSRFVRAAFVKWNSAPEADQELSQFFHLLESVAQPRGCVRLKGALYEKTVYTSCCDTDQGIYYYKTYENSGISAVGLFMENLDGQELVAYPMLKQQEIRWQNR